MALGHGSGRLVGNKAINLDFLAPFLCYFLLATKESKERINKPYNNRDKVFEHFWFLLSVPKT